MISRRETSYFIKYISYFCNSNSYIYRCRVISIQFIWPNDPILCLEQEPSTRLSWLNGVVFQCFLPSYHIISYHISFYHCMIHFYNLLNCKMFEWYHHQKLLYITTNCHCIVHYTNLKNKLASWDGIISWRNFAKYFMCRFKRLYSGNIL